MSSSPNLRSQFYSLYFEIEGGSELRANTPVNVIIESGQMAESVVVPRESATRTSNGEWIVWQKVGAERFVSRQINMKPLNGDEIIINAGVSPGNLIVVSGANLLGNIR
ncbi:MAG: efflux RND transporter periplasmic adaptor subunit [Alphaproteobacteria bacterium]|nr:efflux RND transporter periplasmic adaptor subunit [Alphaproteobacteria bacterium]